MTNFKQKWLHIIHQGHSNAGMMSLRKEWQYWLIFRFVDLLIIPIQPNLALIYTGHISPDIPDLSWTVSVYRFLLCAKDFLFYMCNIYIQIFNIRTVICGSWAYQTENIKYQTECPALNSSRRLHYTGSHYSDDFICYRCFHMME